ncbi:MAG TPA: hypothetical protein VFJ85_16130 [Acidimicrobiales bacterium]|nr:hypothetical protein [Acidimicrobiales bacterium]
MRRVTAVLLAVLATASCRKGDVAEPETTVPTAPSTTATTAVSYAVPAAIDTAYIQKVMAALDHVNGDAARRAASERALDGDFFQRFVSIYTDRYFKLVQRAWLQVAGDKFALLADAPRDPTTSVVRLITANPTCVFFEAKRDFSPMFREPDPPGGPRFVALLPLDPLRNPTGYNPTPWAMNFDGHFQSGAEPTPEAACGPA